MTTRLPMYEPTEGVMPGYGYYVFCVLVGALWAKQMRSCTVHTSRGTHRANVAGCGPMRRIAAFAASVRPPHCVSTATEEETSFNLAYKLASSQPCVKWVVQ